LRKWRADAKLQITSLQSQVATKEQSLQQKEKALNQLTAEHTTLKVCSYGVCCLMMQGVTSASAG
jgi:hypothetical protein